jgi:dihydropteroate synthase
VPISVDTYKPEVMRAALRHGASMINDIYGLRMPGAVEAVAGSDCAVCLMHMQGEPLTMQQAALVPECRRRGALFLRRRVQAARAAGISDDRLLLDPGFGFGKTLQHNLELLRGLDRLAGDGLPVLAGLSRKSMLGAITGRPLGERLAASIAAAVLAVERGARILRVHDVAETRDALAVWQAMRGALLLRRRRWWQLDHRRPGTPRFPRRSPVAGGHGLGHAGKRARTAVGVSRHRPSLCVNWRSSSQPVRKMSLA